MAKVTINAQGRAKNGKVTDMQVTGTTLWLTVEGKRIKFILQDGPQIHVTHFATGRILFNLSAERLGRMAHAGPANVPKDRHIAQAMLDALVTQHGAGKVLAEFAKHPVLNP